MIPVNERVGDHEETLRIVQDALQARMWTALPGIVLAYDPVRQTVSVQPAIMGQIKNPNGSVTPLPLPVLDDVLVHFPGGGGFSLTFPIKPGDECLLVFMSRCLDAWWAQGEVQPEIEHRMHDLSDAVAMVGLRSQPHRLNAVSVASVQLRSDDGSSLVELMAGGICNITAPGGVKITTSNFTLEAEQVAITAALTALTGVVTANEVVIDETHGHAGVKEGTDISGPVAI